MTRARAHTGKCNRLDLPRTRSPTVSVRPSSPETVLTTATWSNSEGKLGFEHPGDRPGQQLVDPIDGIATGAARESARDPARRRADGLKCPGGNPLAPWSTASGATFERPGAKGESARRPGREAPRIFLTNIGVGSPESRGIPDAAKKH